MDLAMYFGPTERRRAFTLIELLVVIGIIGTLIAILLPALSKARQIAKLTLCATNVKSIGTAFATYLTDNRQVYPTGGTQFGPQNAAPFWGDFVGPAGNTAPYNDNERRPLNSYMAEYTNSAKCPFDIGTSDVGGTNTIWMLAGCSYSYPDRTPAAVATNTRVVQFGVWTIEGEKEARITKPSMKLIIADPILFDPTNRPATNQKNWWHNTSERLNASVLFGDGHVTNTGRKLVGDQLSNNALTDDQLLATNEYY